jgi:predicted SnoaL-like aldol condensation-catalyzing enzyme
MVEFTRDLNRVIVLEAFETLFNRRDFAAAEKFWSPSYIQHSAHVPPGREGLFNLVRSQPLTNKYELSLMMAEGDFVMMYGRLSGSSRLFNLIAADIIRMEMGVLVEHWDVLQPEATRTDSKSGNPMFGAAFPG